MKQYINFRRLLMPALALILICTQIQAQVTKRTFSFGPPVVVNFHDLAEKEKANPVALKPRYVEQGEDRDNFFFHPLPVNEGAKVTKILPKSRRATPAAASPSPSQNFAGIESNNTEIPPDINGAVGTTYVIETTNQQFNIYTKSTGTLKSTLTISTLFSPSKLYNYYDPHICYDPNNDRFLIGIDAQTGSSSSSPSAFAVAISATGDPTGSWYIYSVVCTPSAPTDFMDYDQLGYNNNWVVMTGNDFPSSGSNSSHIYVWPRATLYSGAAGTATAFTDATNLLLSPATTYDATQNTEYLVSDLNGNSSGNGYVNIETITGTASAPVYSSGSQLGVNQPWHEPGSTLYHAPELGETAAKGVESGDTRVHSCIYRNGSLWFTHTVFLPASGTITNSAVDWWQVNPSALTVTQFDRIADAKSLIWYYYPSLDVNANGDMLIGYSNSSATTYCGAQYSLHLATDPADTLETPVQFVNGLAGYYQTYGGGRNRWGDFSGTAFDPSDGSFWTFQEWANTGNLWATQVAHIPDGSGTSCGTPSGLNVSSITTTGATTGWTTVSGANSYNLQWGTSLTALTTVTGITSNSYPLSSLSSNTKYYFEVQTVCASGNSSYSTVDSFTTASSCGTPTGLNVSSITTTGATAGWTSVSGANSYNLQWGTSLTALTTVTGITTNSYPLSSLTQTTKYYFEVQTVCASGNSSYSAVDSFTTATGCGTPTGLNVSSITTSGATTGWTAVSGANSYNLQWGTSLTALTTVTGITTNSYPLSSLSSNTKYYFEVQTVCASSNSSYSTVDSFTTANSCGTPTGLNVSSITTTGATTGWTAVSGANSYSLQWGTSLTALTTVTGITTNSYPLSSLAASTKYYFEVETVCASGNSSYSNVDSFTTAAVAPAYCTSKGTSTLEYIKSVGVGSINNTSSNDGGYGNFTSVNTNLTAGTQYTMTLAPGFKSKLYPEYWTVYIDYNQDGILNGTGETVATGKETVAKTSISFTFTVPNTALNGTTRLRIQMQRTTASTNPCATLAHGDVQDFTVTITGGSANPVVNQDAMTAVSQDESTQGTTDKLSIIPNPLSSASYATAVYNLSKEGNTKLQVMDLTGRIVYSQELGMQNAGPHNFLLNSLTGKLVSGYYLVVLEQNNQVIARNRFIVNK